MLNPPPTDAPPSLWSPLMKLRKSKHSIIQLYNHFDEKGLELDAKSRPRERETLSIYIKKTW